MFRRSQKEYHLFVRFRVIQGLYRNEIAVDDAYAVSWRVQFERPNVSYALRMQKLA